MKRLFNRQRKVVAAKLQGPSGRRAVAVGHVDAAEFFQRSQWDAQVREDASELLGSIIESWGQATIDAVLPTEKQSSDTLETKAEEESPQIRFDLTDPRVVELINQQADRVVGVNQTTLDELRAAIAEGVEAGEGVRELAGRVREVFDRASSTRALLIARTETLSAANGGLLNGALQSGVAVRKTWLNAGDARVRAHHQAAGGQTVLTTEPFIVGGAQMMHPGDPNGPAAEVVNCRCTMTFASAEGSAAFGAFGAAD